MDHPTPSPKGNPRAQLQELFLKQGCESGRQWGFVTFASPEEAANAQAPVQRWGRALQKHHHTWGIHGENMGKFWENIGFLLGSVFRVRFFSKGNREFDGF